VSWAEYWNHETSLYVNERHRRLHYDLVTRDVLKHVPTAAARVLDYGCGDTLTARRLARACSHLMLCDAAPRVRAHLLARYADQPNITVITPEALRALPPMALDLIIVNSVVQYLSRAQFMELLDLAHATLAPGGRLLLGDIVPRWVGPSRDAVELIKFAAGNGFLLPALVGLVRSFFSAYRRTRERAGFLRFDEAEIVSLLSERGFQPHRQRHNIGHNAARMTFLAVAAS